MEVSGRRKEMGSDDQITGILCDPCKGVNGEENAVFYCTECNEFLCEVDAKKHRKASMSKAHQLLDRDSMPRHKLGSLEDTICPIHSEKILEYYCNSHSKSCCTVCATKEHKHCEVEYIDDIAKGYEQNNEYKSLIKDINDLMQRLNSAKQNSLDTKSNAQRLQFEIISEIRHFRIEINSILDSLENATLTEAKRVLHVDSNAARSTATSYDTLMAKLQEMTSSIEKLRKYKQDKQLVMHSKNAREQVNDIDNEVSKLPDVNKRIDYKFITDKRILELLRSSKRLGCLEITEESTKTKENDKRAITVSDAEILVPVVNHPVTASHVRDINIEHSTDTKNGLITGGVMLGQTKLVLVDRCNNSVKVVNNKTVESCIKLQLTPWGITCVAQDQVVVSCDEGTLVFLKVGSTLSIVKQLDIGGELRGIACTNNALLVVYGYPDPCVKIMDLTGKTLKTFKTDAAGNNLFKIPWYIALSEDQNTVFVSDRSNDLVTSLRMDGTVQCVYTYDNLKDPSGLAVDRKDNLYVAGSGSHNIFQLSTDCKTIQVLLDTSHGIKYPWMVEYCKTEHKLYIGYGSGSRTNFISVFKLQQN